MRRILCGFLLVSLAVVQAQQPSTWPEFFQQRLNGAPPPPSTDELMRLAIDPIAHSNPRDITAALPIIDASLISDKVELPAEAAMALFAITQRSDGSTLLRGRIPEIEALLYRPEDNLRNCGMLLLQTLTSSVADATLPVIVKFLGSPAQPSFAKVEAAATLLQYGKADPAAMKAVQTFLGTLSDPNFHVAMLECLGRDHVNTPATDAFALQSLTDSNKFIRIAAVHATRRLGSDVWGQAHATVARLATDPGEDKEVKTAAEKELRNTVP